MSYSRININKTYITETCSVPSHLETFKGKFGKFQRKYITLYS